MIVTFNVNKVKDFEKKEQELKEFTPKEEKEEVKEGDDENIDFKKIWIYYLIF
jgi:hypothetical protein